MSKQVSQKRFSGWKKWTTIVVGGIVCIVGTLRLSLMTDMVHDWLKGQIITTANKQLNVHLSVDRLEGDLWKHVTLTGVALIDQDTVASIDTLQASYNIWSFMGPYIELSKLHIVHPYLQVKERNDQWNIAEWMKSGKDTTSSGTGFSIRISDLRISDGKIDAAIAALGRDSAFVVDKFNLSSSLGYYGKEYDADISNLDFSIMDTRLNSPVSIKTNMEASEQSISLEKLVVATGNSVLESAGKLNTQDSTAQFDINATPLSWRDIAVYAEQTPIKHNLEVGLEVKGTMQQLHMGVAIDAKGINKLKIGADIHHDSSFALTGAQLEADKLDLATFLGDTSLPEIHDIDFKVTGALPFNHYESSHLSGAFSTGPVRKNPYFLDKLDGTVSLTEGTALASIATRHQNEQIKADAKIADIWTERPTTTIRLNTSQADPGYWLQDPAYQGNLSLTGNIHGKGLYPDSSRWDYAIRVINSKLFNQSFSKAEFRGKISKAYISNHSILQIDKSSLEFDAEADSLQSIPHFTFKLQTREFNLSELAETDSISSAITGTVDGDGRGSTLETLRLNATVDIDSSVVNGERISRFFANLTMQDTTVKVNDSKLKSTIADGIFDAKMHLTRWYDPSNQLNMNIDIKDLTSIASLVGTDNLQAEGNIKGQLKPSDNERLKFFGEVHLKDVMYDSVFNTVKADGTIESLVMKHPEYSANIDLATPEFSSLKLQNLNVQTKGKMTDNDFDGSFHLDFNSPSEGHIVHAGTYRISQDSTIINTIQYDFSSSLRTLNLAHPFTVKIVDQSVRMDTMRLASDDGAMLELVIPYADSLRQQVYLKGRNLNLTIMQNTLLSEAFFKGILSGKIQINHSDTSMTASGDLLISGLEYEGARLDTLQLNMDIHHKKMTGKLEAVHQGKQLIVGEVDLPFELGNPKQFSETFFERPVDGYLKVNTVRLSRFENLLDQAGISNTEGILAFNGKLEGTAGKPELSGKLRLDKGFLSGVQVDSLIATSNYKHETSDLLLSATVNSLGQKAMEVNAKVPFYVNLKSFDITLPGAQDSISVDIKSHNFNLAALNDFVDHRKYLEIKGEVNGMVHINGPAGNLKTEGQLEFDKGSVRLVEAGIRVDHIQSTVDFEPDTVRLSHFSARSGKGSLGAKGTIALKKLMPGDIDMKITANNFKAANTSEYNAVIDMNTHIGGSFTRPNVTGNLSFINGFIQLRNFGEKSVEDVSLDSAGQQDYSFALYDSLKLNMNISFNRRFFVRNKRYLELEVELDGQLDLLKDENREMQLFGTLSSANGYAKPLGKQFDLKEAAITFSGDPTNPQLNVRTLYEPPQTEQEIKIWYTIEGTVENPKFKYESEPQMELENIISYTLFGQPFYALDSWKQVVANSGSNTTAADVALDVLMDRVESLATQKLGIDVVKIENTRVGGESGTSVTTGWYINARVFFAIQNVITGSTPDTSFLLEYLLQKNLKLIISQGNASRQGLDIKWNYDY